MDKKSTGQNLSIFVNGLQKRYLGILRMSSSPYMVFNKIVLRHDEILTSLDEIYFADEIKSTHPPSRRISSPQGISSLKMFLATRKGEFRRKTGCRNRPFFSGRGRKDLNPEPTVLEITQLCHGELNTMTLQNSPPFSTNN